MLLWVLSAKEELSQVSGSVDSELRGMPVLYGVSEGAQILEFRSVNSSGEKNTHLHKILKTGPYLRVGNNKQDMPSLQAGL